MYSSVRDNIVQRGNTPTKAPSRPSSHSKSLAPPSEDGIVSTAVLRERVLAEIVSPEMKRLQDSVAAAADPCRTVRVFISSTFKDFYNEREILVKQVLPRLREVCEKQGLFLVECDLRWGVPKDATGDDAIVACLGEIQRSIEETKGFNFFLGLLGGRYGWSPKQNEMASHLWERFKWVDGASVTFMEMIIGLLRTQTPYGLVMYRQDDNGFIQQMPKDQQEIFAESKQDPREKVALVREILRKTLSGSGRYQEYSCQYQDMQEDPMSRRKRAYLTGFEDFEEKVFQFFEKCILDLATTVNSGDGSSRMRDEHYLTMKAQLHSAATKVYLIPELEEIEIIQQHSSTKGNPENRLVCLTGDPGSGKSTMMAALVQHLLDNATEAQVFYHFCGASAASKSEENILTRLKERLGGSNESEGSSEKVTFLQLLQQFSQKHERCFVVLDALDEMSNTNWEWLATEDLPANVLFLVSSLRSGSNNSGISIQQYLAGKTIQKVDMPPMGREQSSQFVKSFFHEYGKTLSRAEIELLFQHANCTNPLWLSLACEEVRLHGDYASLEKVITALPEEINALYQQILRRLIQQQSVSMPGEDLLTTFLRCLFVSRAGLWESEVSTLMQFSMKKESPVATRHLSDMLRNLRPFIHLTGAPYPLVKLRHRIVSEVLKAVIFPEDEEPTVPTLHREMAAYYEDLMRNQGEDSRKELELIFHFFRAEMRSRVLAELIAPRCRHIFNPVEKSRFMNYFRCGMMAMAMPPGVGGNNNQQGLRGCHFCLGARMMSPHALGCLYCGMPVGGQMGVPTRMCQLHRTGLTAMGPGQCSLCKKMVQPQILVDLKLCRMCDTVGSFCSVLVDENDRMFNQTVRRGGLAPNLDHIFNKNL